MTCANTHLTQLCEVAIFPAISCEIFATPSGLERITNLKPSSSFRCSFHADYFQGEILAWLKSYAFGEPINPNFPLRMDHLSPFHQKILEEMRRIPFGETASYKEIAKRVDCPEGARAVGNACNKNPFPLLIPCHRVVGSDGSLRGFAGGLDVKSRLLSFEKNHCR